MKKSTPRTSIAYRRSRSKLTEAKRKLIKEKFCSKVLAEHKQQYLDVLLKFHEAISEDHLTWDDAKPTCMRSP